MPQSGDGHVRDVEQRPPILQPLDVALPGLAGGATEEQGGPGEKVGVASDDQVQLLGLPPLDVDLPLGQNGQIRLDRVWNSQRLRQADSAERPLATGASYVRTA